MEWCFNALKHNRAVATRTIFISAMVIFLRGRLGPRCHCPGETRTIPFNALSIVLSVFAFGGIVDGLSAIGALISGVSSTPAIALDVGIIFLGIFVYRQMTLGKRGRALLDLSAFGHKNFTFSVITVFMAMAMMLGVVNVMPIYLQVSLGVIAMVTGLAMLSGGLLQGIVSPFISRICDKVGPRSLVIPGALLMMPSQWWLAFIVSEDTSFSLVIGIIVVFNVGMALVMTRLMTVSLPSLPMNPYGHGSAIMNTLQQVGGAAGTAAVIASVFVGPLPRTPRTVSETEPAARESAKADAESVQ